MTAPRRVLLWTETYQVGGADRFLADLTNGLDPERWSCRLASNPLSPLAAYMRERTAGRLDHLTVPVASLREPALGRWLRALRGASPAEASSSGGRPTPGDGAPGAAHRTAAGLLRAQQAATNVLRLRRLLRRERPDVLHVNNGGYPGGESCRVICLAARAEGVPRVVHFVHNMAYAPAWPHAWERALDRRVDHAVDAWATAAGRASVALAAERAIDPAGIHTVHYGLPERPVRSRDGALRAGLGFDAATLGLVVVAAFEPRKGHAVLLDALRAVRGRGLDARAALVGTGELLEPMRRRAAELGLADVVAFLGWREDVDSLLAASDALVLPSLANECLPYAILEAMAQSLPVVGTDVAGIPEEIADGESGFVVAPGEPAPLADAIEALADPGRREALGAAGRARVVERFSVERMVSGVTGLWDQPGRS